MRSAIDRLHLAPVIAAALVGLAAPRPGAGQPAPDHGRHRHHAVPGPGAAEPGVEAEELRHVPDLRLLDQDGEEVRFYSDLVADKVVAMNFIFTTCTTVCPPMGAIFGKLQRQLGERAGRDVHLISVSVDPRTDTPERLEAWRRRFGTDRGWTLVTGEKTDVDQLLKSLEVFTPDFADHSPTVLVGNARTGMWKRAYGIAPAATLLRLIDEMAAGEDADRAQHPGRAAEIDRAREDAGAGDDLGRRIYFEGVGTRGREITAVLGSGGTEVAAAMMPCASCHGEDGHGRPEGGLSPSDVTWPALTRPYGTRHASGREHPPYTPFLAERAVTMGLDAAGNPLHVAMPRYRLTRDEAGALVGYLERLGREPAPGVGDDRVRIGVVLPPAEAGGLGRVLAATLAAAAARVNDAGGIYGRRLELRFFEPPRLGRDAVADFLAGEEVFALAASFIAGADAEIAELAGTEKIPLIGPVSVAPATGFPLNRFVFYLTSGWPQQARALVDFAARAPATRRAVVIHPSQEVFGATVEAIHDQGGRHGEAPWNAIATIAYPPGRLDAGALAREQQSAGTDAVFFLGSESETAAFLRAAGAHGWRPRVFLLSPLAGSAAFDAEPELADRLFLASPTLPTDATPRGFAGYRELARSRGLPSEHLASQLAALAAFELLTEGLEGAGRELSREKLIAHLESLYRHETALTPALTFGPNRRIGALGAYVVALDLERRELHDRGEWITPR